MFWLGIEVGDGDGGGVLYPIPVQQVRWGDVSNWEWVAGERGV